MKEIVYIEVLEHTHAADEQLIKYQQVEITNLRETVQRNDHYRKYLQERELKFWKYYNKHKGDKDLEHKATHCSPEEYWKQREYNERLEDACDHYKEEIKKSEERMQTLTQENRGKSRRI